ncbi:histidinol-phosphatase [Corynebacterium yudongzhengii]|uniref:Histidinol-phosphatase n=1 Tax=Corynebacterium yudongzhengii TaxID=2080740 RepID=A0A2U1T485_9CORY|nr:histidinol-phosphatase [Corynebacterium yudongzhengii]AWB82394.1 histidinol-phosphatase [Corynebacterium yudongzhengii]PWC00819.1 histidinol-phosphatase [Corynebacterium yudongzhengii]
MTSYADDLALAIELADAADSLTTEHFESADLQVDTKPDMTPVSEADVAVEEALREKLTEARPSDALLGEEFGGDVTFSGRQWVIDPIDGTKNYVRGVPVWATLIALLDDGEPVVGVISAPALNRRWWASKDSGAWRIVDGGSPRRLGVSGVSSLADASVSFSSLSGWAARGLRDNFLALTEKTWRLRGYGDFYSYCLVAEGTVDIACEPEVSLWDLAALSVLVTEAGGRFSALSGEPGPHGGDALATNGKLHEDTLSVLGA